MPDDLVQRPAEGRNGDAVDRLYAFDVVASAGDRFKGVRIQQGATVWMPFPARECTTPVGMLVAPMACCLSRDGLDCAIAAISDIDIESLPFI